MSTFRLHFKRGVAKTRVNKTRNLTNESGQNRKFN